MNLPTLQAPLLWWTPPVPPPPALPPPPLLPQTPLLLGPGQPPQIQEQVCMPPRPTGWNGPPMPTSLPVSAVLLLQLLPSLAALPLLTMPGVSVRAELGVKVAVAAVELLTL